MTALKAISFDLWDTVFIDDSDEAKRAQAGLSDKKTSRRDLVCKAVQDQVDHRRQVEIAYATSDAAFHLCWHQQHVTWAVRQRLQIILDGLGATLDEVALSELVRAHEEMELEYMPDLVPGVAEAIAELAQCYTLVVVSDAIFSPGRCLRQILEHYDLLRHFSGFVFSDEAGVSKPAPQVFHKAAEAAGCALGELVHLGDREHNDIAGPQALGARAVLITAARDRGSKDSRADAVCSQMTELSAVIAHLQEST